MIRFLIFFMIGWTQAQDYSPFWTLPIDRQKALISGYESQQIGNTQKQQRWIGYSFQSPQTRYGIELVDQMDLKQQQLRLGLGQKQWLSVIAVGDEFLDAQFEVNQNWTSLALWQSFSYRTHSTITEQSYLHSNDEFQAIFGGELNYNTKISLGLSGDLHLLSREFAPSAKQLTNLRGALSFFVLGTNQGATLPLSPLGLRSSWKRQGLIYEAALEQRFWGNQHEIDAVHSLQCALQKGSWGLSLREFYVQGIDENRSILGSDLSANFLLGTWVSQFQFGQTRPLFQRNAVWNLSINFKKLLYQP